MKNTSVNFAIINMSEMCEASMIYELLLASFQIKLLHSLGTANKEIIYNFE